MVTRLLRPLFVAMLLAANIVHPFLHELEGGTLDMILDWMNVMAAEGLSKS